MYKDKVNKTIQVTVFIIVIALLFLTQVLTKMV